MSRNENAKAQAPERPNFTRRCSLFSRYLKEKGSFGNIDLRLVRKPDCDNGLFGNSDPPGKQNAIDDIFQRISKGEACFSSGGKAKDANLSEPKPGSSQLTIFFGGKILVYNEFPAYKAKEIMAVAKQAKSVTENSIHTKIKVESNMVLPDLNEPINSEDADHIQHTMEQLQQQQNQVVERIARRASLHRFFAKRKDRAVARAPYHANQNSGLHQYPTKLETVACQPLEQGQSSGRPDIAVFQAVSHLKTEGDKDILMEVEEEGQSLKDLELRL